MSHVTFSETIKTEVCSLKFSERCFFSALKALIDEQDPGEHSPIILTTQMVKIFKFLKENLNFFLPELQTKIYFGTKTMASRRKYLMEIAWTPELTQKIRLCDFRCRDCCRAYIAGIFLSCGSVNDPEGKYNHLELRLRHEKMVPVVTRLLKKFKIIPLHIVYRDYDVLYIKKADQISDFLKLINATDQFYNFENLKIARDFGINIQRLTNLEVSNVKRVIAANEKLLKLFKKLQQFPELRKHLSARDNLYFAMIERDPSQSLVVVAQAMTEKIGHLVSKNILHHTRQKVINLLRMAGLLTEDE